MKLSTKRSSSRNPSNDAGPSKRIRHLPPSTDDEEQENTLPTTNGNNTEVNTNLVNIISFKLFFHFA